MTLSAINITKTFRDGGSVNQVFENLSISFPAAGCVYLVGKSGGGKSTLLNILGGIESVDSGMVTLNNRDISRIGEYLRDHVAFLHQRANLLGFLNARANVVLACDLKRVCFDEKKYRALVASMDLCGHDEKPISQLSFGMCQRFALIQALLSKARIILLDEPTGSVDLHSRSIIKKTIEKYSKDRLFVIATHDLKLISSGMVVDLDNLGRTYDFNNDRYALVKRGPLAPFRWNLYSWKQFSRDWKKAALIVSSQAIIATAIVVMLVLFYQGARYIDSARAECPYNRIITIESSSIAFEKSYLDKLVADYGVIGYNPYLDLNSLILKNDDDYLDVQSFQCNPDIAQSSIKAGRMIGNPGEILVNQALVDRGVNLGEQIVGTVAPITLVVVGVIADEFNSLPGVYYQDGYLPVGLSGDMTKVNLVVEDYTQIARLIDSLKGDFYAYSDFLTFKESYSNLLALAGFAGAFFIVVALVIGVILYSLVISATFYQRHQDNCLLLILGLNKRGLLGNMIGESLAVGMVISMMGSFFGLIATNFVKEMDFIPDFLKTPLKLDFTTTAGLFLAIVLVYSLVGLVATLSQLNTIRKLKISQVLKEE